MSVLRHVANRPTQMLVLLCISHWIKSYACTCNPQQIHISFDDGNPLGTCVLAVDVCVSLVGEVAKWWQGPEIVSCGHSIWTCHGVCVHMCFGSTLCQQLVDVVWRLCCLIFECIHMMGRPDYWQADQRAHLVCLSSPVCVSVWSLGPIWLIPPCTCSNTDPCEHLQHIGVVVCCQCTWIFPVHL